MNDMSKVNLNTYNKITWSAVLPLSAADNQCAAELSTHLVL